MRPAENQERKKTRRDKNKVNERIQLKRRCDQTTDRRHEPNRNRKFSNHNSYLTKDSMVLNLDEVHWPNECILNLEEFDKENNEYVRCLNDEKNDR